MSKSNARADLGADTVWQDLLATSMRCWGLTLQNSSRHHVQNAQSQTRAISENMAKLTTPMAFWGAWADYVKDAHQRVALTMDVLQKRADITKEHNAQGNPPVLIYDYDVVLEGRDLQRPSNYQLLSILPPQGVQVHSWKRPYMIIDPRAGHGPGIGGLKKDSQVGVALKDGHPVYFVAFHPDPVPGQTIADVTYTEAAFLREIARRHPDSPKPVVVGNCQGGWATAILAATHPTLTGPVVLNGAPMSYWGGKIGQDPMRYSGGLNGGVVPALLSADLGGGIFDGAHLVQNFEGLNPGRTWFRKYADLFADPENSAERFLEFERWWGGFFMMTKEEIRWIVETLFIGNKLGKNEAFLEAGTPIDLKQISAPVICFASHGDNITPPAQALNWIVDTYDDETEIEIRGQRILYMVHSQVGHLGIFVSSSVARREHSNMASTLKTIEALPPGLYEMMIEDHEGEDHAMTFKVSFGKRKMQDIVAITGDRRDEAAFAGVARMSEASAEMYETAISPAVRAAITPHMADEARKAHLARVSRTLLASGNPSLYPILTAARHARETRSPAAADNPFLFTEKLFNTSVEAGLDMFRDLRGAAQEAGFLALWANPLALQYGEPYSHARAQHRDRDLCQLPEVQTALSRKDVGGLAEAVVRMLILLANTRGEIRQDRVVRSAEVMHNKPPFDTMDEIRRRNLIREQDLICRFSPDAALQTLVQLLPQPAEQRQALAFVDYVVGEQSEMAPTTLDLMRTFKSILTGGDTQQ